MFKKKKIIIIAAFAMILLLITMMDTFLVFQMTSKQTMESGKYQIENISSEIQNTISDGQTLTSKLALKAQGMLDNKEELKAFIETNKEELDESTGGKCYNLYIAGTGWDIIPDLEKPEGFVATERSWYTGAKAKQGETYVTTPYVDAWTGNICYSVSLMLDDGDTVIGIDYDVSYLNDFLKDICANGAADAVIITEDGIVAGSQNSEKVTKDLATAYPEYAGVFSLAKGSDDLVNMKVKSGNKSNYLFATQCSNGWYLIVSENNWQMYKNSYLQLIVTIGLSIGLFIIIIIMYLITKNNQIKAESALEVKEKFISNISGELREPLSKIRMSAKESDMKDYDSRMAQINSATEQLTDMIEQMISYSSIVKAEADDKGKKTSTVEAKKLKRNYRIVIIVLLVIAMFVSLYTNISATYSLGEMSMRNEVCKYEDQLAQWISTQKSILDMFCSIISNHPEMLDDYEGTVEYLNEITMQYPEISVTYMTNPNLEHTVYMNNGWEPDDDWHVEERQWYIDTLASPTHWSISAPYYDEQTGYYCVTISESVYDSKTGEFLGNFGIDFYMDKLVDILGSSYSNDGYAFLVDAQGEIINHPYGQYQMSVGNIVNVNELSYSDVETDGVSTEVFTDYDGVKKLVIATKDEISGFTVYKVSSIWTIFGKVVVYGTICLVVFLICIVIIYRLITQLMIWQYSVNKQLKEAADTAIAAGNAKSQFLAQMSHEIRTPINAVLGMNEMILRESQDNDIREYASNIQSSGRTLLALINSILDFSKIEDGKMEIVPAEYDSASFVHDLVNSINERAKAKGLELKVNIDPDIPATMYGDDVRITQIVSNLLTNAVKYTEEGTVTLTIEAREIEDDSSNDMKGSLVDLYVEVKDTGIGIRDEDRAKLFESFQRLDEQRNRSIEGTGLGMSIVTKLLGMMGSKLEVESVYGEGSVFSFVIRQGVVSEQGIGDYSERLALSNQNSSDREYLYAPTAKILVVDDNEMNLKVIRGLIKRNGIVPDTAISGMEAIECVKKVDYDVIFLDHMMPKMDGIETLQMLRKEKLLKPTTTVVALTANAIMGAKEMYLQAGFKDYLSKPIEVEQLEKRLALYLPDEKVGFIKPDVSDKNTTEANYDAAVTADKTGVTNVQNAVDAVDGLMMDMGDEYTMEEITNLNMTIPDLNVVSGLGFCMGSKSFYQEMLREFVKGDKRESLEQFMEAKDYENYKIQIHALKGNAKNIGAQILAESAKGLEYAIKDENFDYVLKYHDSVMKEYGKMIEAIDVMLTQE